MQTIIPDYYSDFKCIADKCRHNCCIGWEIEIDNDTLEKYKSIDGDFGIRLKSNIEFNESPHFKLDREERCPFLNSSGLCDIIANFGEGMLCQICADHPRFRNFYDGFTEIGLGLCCEAAGEKILAKKEKTTLNLTPEALKIPLVNFREKLFSALQDRKTPLEVRIDNILGMVDAKLPENIDWYAEFNKLEKLDDAWDEYLLRIKDGIERCVKDHSLDVPYEQLLVYLIYRHFLDCQYDEMVSERVLFAVLIYKVIKTMNISNTLEELIEIARLYSCEIEYSDENINKLLLMLK